MALPEYKDLTDTERRIADEARLRFLPPYIEHSSNPEGFEFTWRQLQYAFGLPDPSLIPPVQDEIELRDAAALQRFVASCQELSTYSLLNYGGEVKFTWNKDGTSSVEVDNPPKEMLRGFTVLFRQIHDDTNASFKVVSTILGRFAAQAQDESASQRREYVRQWRSARKALLQETLRDIAQAKLLQAQGAPPEFPDFKRQHTPLELLSLFNYGDYIHWGDKRVQHSALICDPFEQAGTELQFHLVMIGLAHFYLGYAKMLESLSVHRILLALGREQAIVR